MSDIFKEFMRNYNELAKINDKPLLKIAEAGGVDWYEPGSDLDNDQSDDDSSIYMPPEQKPMVLVELKAAFLDLSDALNAIRRVVESEENKDLPYMSRINRVGDMLHRAQTEMGLIPDLAFALKDGEK